MNKSVILFFATIGGIAGSYLPYLLGDRNGFDSWNILGGFVGGIAGIWLGAIISKRMD